jgi:hypothetical protein
MRRRHPTITDASRPLCVRTLGIRTGKNEKKKKKKKEKKKPSIPPMATRLTRKKKKKKKKKKSHSLCVCVTVARPLRTRCATFRSVRLPAPCLLSARRTACGSTGARCIRSAPRSQRRWATFREWPRYEDVPLAQKPLESVLEPPPALSFAFFFFFAQGRYGAG